MENYMSDDYDWDDWYSVGQYICERKCQGPYPDVIGFFQYERIPNGFERAMQDCRQALKKDKINISDEDLSDRLKEIWQPEENLLKIDAAWAEEKDEVHANCLEFAIKIKNRFNKRLDKLKVAVQSTDKNVSSKASLAIIRTLTTFNLDLRRAGYRVDDEGQLVLLTPEWIEEQKSKQTKMDLLLKNAREEKYSPESVKTFILEMEKDG